MIRKKKDILLKIKQNRVKIRTFGVNKIGLFGSYIRDEQNRNSDIDLLIEFDRKEKTFDNFINLSNLLENILPHKRIELVTTESLSPYIRPHIMKEVKYVTIRH
jgi:hypothetical protein